MCKANKYGQATIEWVDNPKFYYQKFDITCRTIAYRINIDLVLTDGSPHELSTNRFKRKTPHGSTDEHLTIFGMPNITEYLNPLETIIVLVLINHYPVYLD